MPAAEARRKATSVEAVGVDDPLAAAAARNYCMIDRLTHRLTCIQTQDVHK